MRILTKKYEIFNFDDVMQNEQLKEKVLEKHYYINVEDIDWYQWTLKEWETKLNDFGFDNVEIDFSGFYSQGDGASFTCKNIDIEKLADVINKKYPNIFKNRDVRVLKALYNQGYIYGDIGRNNCHYYHANSVTTNIYTCQMQINWSRLEKLVNDFDCYVSDFVCELCYQIYDDLYNEYEYLISEKAILETLQANEYEFYSNGDIA